MSQYSQIDPSRDGGRSTRAPLLGRTAVVGATQSALGSEREQSTYDELYEEARKRGLKGRSKMSKTELERALGR